MHYEGEHKSLTGTPVCIWESKCLYQWALVGSLFEASQWRPYLCHDCTRYISWHGTRWINQSNRQRDPGRQESEKTGKGRWIRDLHQRHQEQLFLQRRQRILVRTNRTLLSHLLAIGEKFFENEGWEEKSTLLGHLLAIWEKLVTVIEYTRVSWYLHSYFYSTYYILTLNYGWTQSSQIHYHTCWYHSIYKVQSLFWTGFCKRGWSWKH